MDDLPTTRSFTPLATIPLAHPHVLHPDACNPTMDLVVLILEDAGDAVGGGGSAAAFGSKGKGKAGPGVRTKVALWRMSGSKVWEVDVAGRVLGLAWSRDGSFLSLLLLKLDPWPETDASSSVNKSSIEHLNVHTGDIVKIVPVPRSLIMGLEAVDWMAAERSRRAQWWPMAWEAGGDAWDKPNPGSSLMVIDSLPRVTPVEPPKPAVINPFAVVAPTAKAKPGNHPKLTTFPALLPATPAVAPDVLVLSPPARDGQVKGADLRLLTGTFPLVQGTPRTPSSTTLGLAQRADRIERLVDVIFRGLTAAETAFKESEKQSMIWREELEQCGEQQGMTIAGVHADLFRFLMTSRSGPAVGEWLGNRMANRTIAKWEATLDTAFATLQKVVSQSISPALERIILILDELRGWSGDLVDCDLVLDRDGLNRAIEVARGMAVLVETMRQDAETEQAAADEWCRWLRYELTRINAASDETLPVAMFDLKLVWSFMKNGFVCSKLRQNLPNVPEAKDDVLPASVPAKRVSPDTNLDSVMRATLTRLTAPPAPELLASPPVFADQSYSPHASPLRAGSVEPMSSPDTMGSPDNGFRPEPPVERVPQLEPWSWANSLSAICQNVILSAHPRDAAPPTRPDDFVAMIPGSFLSERSINGDRWIVSMQSSEGLNLFVADDHSLRGARLVVPDAEIVQAAFFDDEELAVVFQLAGERFMATATISALEDTLMVSVSRAGLDLAAVAAALPPSTLPIARCRALGPTRHAPATEPWLLSLNGRAGRRTACILTRGGAEVEVLDMDGNEDDEEEEDEEEGEEEGDDVDME